MPEISIGVYRITNLINNKIYIGSSSYSIEVRFRRHRSMLNRNIHPNKHLQASWNKYGKDNFSFEVIAICPKKDCIKLEQYYIDTLFPSFNKSPIAGSSLGRKATKETKLLMSLIRKGKKLNYRNKSKTGFRVDYFKNNSLIGKHIKTNETVYFSSFLEAEKHGLDRFEIKRQINGRRKSYRNYIWSLGGVPFQK